MKLKILKKEIKNLTAKPNTTQAARRKLRMDAFTKNAITRGVPKQSF